MILHPSSSSAPSIFAPESEEELAEQVRLFADQGATMSVLGGNTRNGFGSRIPTQHTLSTRGLTDIVDFEPEALTLVAQAGAKLQDIETLLAKHRVALPFEPVDLRALYGSGDSAQDGAEDGAQDGASATGSGNDSSPTTLGGIVATRASGARQIARGTCRDSLLGARFVDGLGRRIKAGGRVMKNVTGYDVTKLMCGSHGTLGVITEVSLRLMPYPPCSCTLLWFGLSDEQASSLMISTLGSPYAVTGATHLPGDLKPSLAGFDCTRGVTALRLEGLAQQVSRQREQLAQRFASLGRPECLTDDEPSNADTLQRALWRTLNGWGMFAPSHHPMWMLTLKPSESVSVVRALQQDDPLKACYQCGGGQVWLQGPPVGSDDTWGEALNATEALAPDHPAILRWREAAHRVRTLAADAGGVATLMRCPPALGNCVPVFHPLSPGVARLNEQVTNVFNPGGRLNPGRMD